MNGVAPSRPRSRASAIFIAAAIAVIVLFIAVPQEAARGWLIAFSVFSQIALGSLALLLIHNLTRTRWGAAFGPVLRRLLWGVPLLAVFFLAIGLSVRGLYPWAASPASVPADVARILSQSRRVLASLRRSRSRAGSFSPRFCSWAAFPG